MFQHSKKFNFTVFAGVLRTMVMKTLMYSCFCTYAYPQKSRDIKYE